VKLRARFCGIVCSWLLQELHDISLPLLAYCGSGPLILAFVRNTGVKGSSVAETGRCECWDALMPGTSEHKNIIVAFSWVLLVKTAWRWMGVYFGIDR
jgi:hypothetical protein